MLHARSLLKDSVSEMMTLTAYKAWMAKAKNGALNSEQAKIKWDEQTSKPDAITDELGDSIHERLRLAVKKQDLVIERAAQRHLEGYEQRQGENKKTTDAQLGELQNRLDGSDLGLGDDDMPALMDFAKNLVGGSVSSPGGSCSSVGVLSSQLGNIKKLCNRDDDEAAAAAKAARQREEGTAPDEESKGSKDKDETWFGREQKITDAIKSHKARNINPFKHPKIKVLNKLARLG